MAKDKIRQAWLHGFVRPQDSPDFVLPVDMAQVAQRDGKVLLEDLIRFLARLLREARRLGGTEVSLAALVDVAFLKGHVALVAVDVERGQEIDLPLDPQTSLGQDNVDQAHGVEAMGPPAPAASDYPPGVPSGADAGGVASHGSVYSFTAPVEQPPPAQGTVDSHVRGGDRQADDTAKTEAAIWLAWRILKRFATGELQTYDEMDKAISVSPNPDLTRRYVATVRSTDPDIVTARGLLCWTGLNGVRDPLPHLAVAGVNIRCWDIDEVSKSGTVQVLRLHASSMQYAEILDPRVTNPKPLMVEVGVPADNTRALLEIAMPKGWSIRAVLSIGRKLLMPDRVVVTVIHAELPPQLPPEFCKVQIDSLIDAATASSEQLGLWDGTM